MTVVSEKVRPAQPGDTGTVIAYRLCGPSSGLALLLLQTEEGDFLEVYGDWRPIRDAYDELVGQRVTCTEDELGLSVSLRAEGSGDEYPLLK